MATKMSAKNMASLDSVASVLILLVKNAMD
jgi:hypothetical protein